VLRRSRFAKLEVSTVCEKVVASTGSFAVIRRLRFRSLALTVLGCTVPFLAANARADVHTTGVPQLSSLPGAPYTLYLDFAGFNFTGTWGGTGQTPGSVEAFDHVSGSFDAAEQTRISEVWAGAAQAYTAFNINVTTVDPAVAAGQADTDAHRQAYYEQTARLMHTIMTPSSGWYGPYGGVSYVDVTQYSYNPVGYNGGAGAGWHTNWDFADTWYSNQQAAQPAIHENGHGLNLLHQGDYQGSTNVSEYSLGDGNSANGTYAPIMGAAYYTQRGAWRLGDSNNGTSGHTQNDVADLLGNSGLGSFRDDGIGHTQPTATPLPLSGTSVNYNLAKGIITPASATSPTPMGASNYTSDYFAFQAGTAPISLTVHDGTEFLSPGTADPGATLRSTLTIYNAQGLIMGTGVEDASTLFETFSGTLPAGNYYAKVSSYGGHAQTLGSYNTTYYYDMGSYFLTGVAAVLLAGDANLDDKVDINDMAIVLANYHHSGTDWATGDFNNDNTVDINDLAIVLAHYNQSFGASDAGIAAVPEPTAITLLLAGAACLLGYSWRRRLDPA
jgi:hypothetical protein